MWRNKLDCRDFWETDEELLNYFMGTEFTEKPAYCADNRDVIYLEDVRTVGDVLDLVERINKDSNVYLLAEIKRRKRRQIHDKYST